MHDWKSFQTIFYTKKKIYAVDPQGPIYLVAEGRAIIALLSEGEDLSRWVGEPWEEIVAEFSHREIILFEREKVDQWIASGLDQPHFYDQIQNLRTLSQPTLLARTRAKNDAGLGFTHFLLVAIETWWQKVLPSIYGIYIHLTTATAPQTLLVMIKRGKIESFHIPDLSPLMPIHRSQPAQIVKHLSGHYMMPVQGLFLAQATWQEWSEASNPWEKIAGSLKANRNQLVPFQWSLFSLILSRRYLGL